MGTKYKRVLLKISGEALLGNQQFGIDYEPVEMIAHALVCAVCLSKAACIDASVRISPCSVEVCAH